MSNLAERISAAWDSAMGKLEAKQAERTIHATAADAIPPPMNFAGDTFAVVRDPQASSHEGAPFDETGFFINQGSRR